jgi:hypothetical protein
MAGKRFDPISCLTLPRSNRIPTAKRTRKGTLEAGQKEISEMKARITMFGVAAVAFIGYKIFFVDSGEVLKFNDTLVDIVVASDSNFEPYLGFLNQYAEGKEVDVALMTEAQDQLKAKIETDLQTLREITVPDDELCKEFHSHSVAYISNSADVVDKYQEQIAYISENNPGVEKDLDAVGAFIAEPLAKDQQLFQAVVETQGKMAAKFDFELEN